MKLAKRMLATLGVAALLLGGASLPSAPAYAADGVNGEVRGFLWGSQGNANWEGTYRMPGGVEAWCASVWQPEPIHATNWSEPRRLTYNDGSYFGDSEMSILAYVVSEASHSVLYKVGHEADTSAAATSVIIHDMTFKNPIPANGNQPYSASWPLTAFGSGEDPEGTGQNATNVPNVYDSLLAEAQLYHGTWNITLDAGNTDGARIGDTVTVTGTLRARGTVAIPNKEVSLDISGATGPDYVTTDASGNFSFDVVTAARQVSVQANRVAPADVVNMRVPTEWQSGRTPQNMIEVNTNKVFSDVLGFSVTQRTSVSTSATDQSDGDKTLPWDGGVIIDRIKYSGLTPGQQYTVQGQLMEQSTGDPTGLKSEATFTPEAEDGVVALEFSVPRGYAGTSLVVFERLYDLEGALVAAHEDIDDDAQTVRVGVPPVTPRTETPPRLSATGSGPMLPLTLGGLLLAAVGLASIGVSRRLAQR